MDHNIVSSVVRGVGARLGLFSIILLLALINWFGEARKLQILLKKLWPIDILGSLCIVFSGMAISNVTPARTGDFFGRSLAIPAVSPLKVTLATIVSNLAQVSCTYVFGLFSLLWLILFAGASELGIDNIKLGGLLLFVVLTVILVIYRRKIYQSTKEKLPRTWRDHFSILENYNREVLTKVFGLSIVRYLAFSIQFFLILQLFTDSELSPLLVLSIPATYLVQSLIPVPSLTDIGVRLYVCLLIFGNTIDKPELLVAVTTLWFLNLIVPGLLGASYLLLNKFTVR